MPVRKSLNRIPSSPTKNILAEEEPMSHGIVTILRSDCERSKSGSIRRTLSADMSSKKWLEQNGFLSPMKKIVSSEALAFPSNDSSSPSSSSSSSSESDEEYEESPKQDDVWRAIQAQKERDQMEKPAQIQVWGSLLPQKSENSLLPPPYVHPIVKRSANTLSEKSLEICTENLGSETGSDFFSFSCCSEILSDGDDEKEGRQKVVRQELKDSNLVADSHVAKKSPAPSFTPPPLPSIAGGDGPSLHMHSHREKGRLVLEAVSVPPRNYLHAQRQDGRLLLTSIHAPATTSKNEVTEFEKVFDNMEAVNEDIQEEDKVENDRGDDGYEEDVEAEEETVEEQNIKKEEKFVMEQNLSLPSEMVRVHKSGLLMKKLMAVGNINPTWSKKIYKADELIVVEEELTVPQPLPPPPRMTRLIPPPAAASFKAYEYVWRNKTTVSGGFNSPLISINYPNKINDGTKGYENQDLVLMKGNKTEQFVPYLRGCREARRSLLIWEPYCIATS